VCVFFCFEVIYISAIGTVIRDRLHRKKSKFAELYIFFLTQSSPKTRHQVDENNFNFKVQNYSERGDSRVEIPVVKNQNLGQ